MEILRYNQQTETCRNIHSGRVYGESNRTAAFEVPAAETVLSQWYDEFGTDILRYCFMFLGNKSDAEDATQETFLKAWRNIGRFEARNG